MKGRRHSPEQVVRKLREADRLLAEGADVDAVCRHLEISVQTYQRWRAQFKAMRPEDFVRLKALEKENAGLKRIVGEQALEQRYRARLRAVANLNTAIENRWYARYQAYQQRTADVVALTAMKLLRLTREAYAQYLTAAAEVEQHVARTAASRAAETLRKLTGNQP